MYFSKQIILFKKKPVRTEKIPKSVCVEYILVAIPSLFILISVLESFELNYL